MTVMNGCNCLQALLQLAVKSKVSWAFELIQVRYIRRKDKKYGTPVEAMKLSNI